MMPPAFFFIIAGTYLFSGIAALLIRRPRLSRVVGFGGCAVASLLGLVLTLVGSLQQGPFRLPLPAPVPWVASELHIDGLSAFFLVLIYLVGFFSSLYAVGYMREFDERRRAAAPLLFGLLLASMLLVVSSGDMLSFLLGWEGMSLASYFLVVLEHEKEDARRAGLIYLIATHIGTGGILVAFLFLMRTTGSFSFNGFAQVPIGSPAIHVAILGFALLGFGTKAGMFPFHIWLPYAHPEAPSPVSAVMSGVMIKMGLYGIVRFLFYLLPVPPPAFGVVLMALGLLSGFFGVLYAVSQHDLKRLLAFSSVENMGIILLGVGASAYCLSTGSVEAGRLLLAGGLFHALSHALFKSLLFMGAGSVLQGAHTRSMERLGGLIKGMPWTGAFFFVGCLAISAVPPLNGFAGEFAIYRGLWAVAGSRGPGSGLMLAAMAGLALIGGLAFLGFVKVMGMVFLGNARSPAAAAARDPQGTMVVPMGGLAVLCVVFGVFPSIAMDRILDLVPAFGPPSLPPDAAGDGKSLAVAAALAIAIGSLVVLRSALVRRKGKREYETWACGFHHVTPRMQYTASSFADPVLHVFRSILRRRSLKEERLSGRFLLGMEYETRVQDLLENGLYLPLYRLFIRASFVARRLHTGYIHLYLGYILGTIVLLLVFFH